MTTLRLLWQLELSSVCTVSSLKYKKARSPSVWLYFLPFFSISRSFCHSVPQLQLGLEMRVSLPGAKRVELSMVLSLTCRSQLLSAYIQPQTIELQTQASGPDTFTSSACLRQIPTETRNAICILSLKHLLLLLLSFLTKSKLKCIPLKIHQGLQRKLNKLIVWIVIKISCTL